MGIKGFDKFFKSCYHDISINELKHNQIIIDAFHKLYSLSIGIRNSGKDKLNNKGDNINHLYALFKYTMKLIKNKIIPLYVFDNKNPDIKKKIIKDRVKHREKAQKKYDLLKNNNTDNLSKSKQYEMNKYFKRIYTLKEYQIKECQQLLYYMGIPFVLAFEEADSQCAALSYYSNMDNIISDDTDIIVFGGKCLLKNKGKNKNYFKKIKLMDILLFLTNEANIIRKKYNLTEIYVSHDNFIDFAILMGSEYICNIKGISNESLFNALSINEFNIPATINYIKNNYKYIYIPSDFINKWIETRTYYKNAKVYDPSTFQTSLNKPDVDNIIKLMCTDNNFNQKYIKSNINLLNNFYKKLNN